MADTQALVISLAKSLLNLAAQDYILYLDNLFGNGLLAKTLGQLDIEIMGTTCDGPAYRATKHNEATVWMALYEDTKLRKERK